MEKGKNGGGNNATAQIAEGNGTAVEVSSDGSSAEANVAANISAAEEEEEETTAASAVAEDEPPQKPTEQSPEEALEVAVHHLERAVALDPSFDKAHEMLGSALEELGRTEDAMAALAAAFERHPGPATVAPHPGTSEKDESGKEEGGSVLTNPVLRKLQALARKLKEEKNAAAVGGSDGDESVIVVVVVVIAVVVVVIAAVVVVRSRRRRRRVSQSAATRPRRGRYWRRTAASPCTCACTRGTPPR